VKEPGTRRTITPFFIATIGILSVLSLANCKHEIPVNPNDGGSNGIPSESANCSADSVYFTNTIQPLLNSTCALTGCHDAITRKDGIELTSYQKIMSTGGVTAGNPSNSKLYKIIIRTDNERMPPPPQPAFTSAQKDLVYKWILQGARNNACNACDTAAFTYAAVIGPLVNTYCKGCHNPSSLGGGIDLSSYTTVKTQALNGKLMGTITQAAGYSPMPKGGTKLSDCRIKQVQKWIAAGTLNN
jgi:mono/diheme cytochrome c family protein